MTLLRPPLLHRLVLPLSLTLVVLMAACSSKAERVALHLERGETLLKQSDWDRASVEVRNVLQMEPANARGYLLAARIEEGRGEVQRAFGFYAKAVELQPELAGARTGKARIHMLAGDLDDADRLVAGVLEANPRDLEARTVKAAVRARRGDAAGAITEANAIIASEPRIPAEPSLLLAALYGNEGQARKAFEVVAAALVAEPDNLSLHVVAAQISDKPAVAAEHYRRAVALAPRNTELWTAWGLHHARQGEVDAAEKVLRDAVAAQPDEARRMLALLDFLFHRRGVAQAQVEYERFAQAQPRETVVRAGMADLYRQAGQPKDADRLLREVIDIDAKAPAALAARNQLALQKLAAGDTAEARTLIDEILALAARDPTALLLRGRLRLADGKPAEAVIDLRAAAKDQRASPEVVGLLARAHLAAGEPQLARDVLNGAVELQPTNVDLRLLLVADLLRADEKRAAVTELDRVVQQHPTHVRAHELRALAAVAAKDWDRAERTLVALERNRPGDPVGALRLGQFHADRGRLDAAMKAYEAAARLAPASPEPALAIIGLMLARGDHDAAQARVDAMAKARPADVLPLQLAGEIALARGRLDAAQQAYEEMIRRAPAVRVGYQQLARVKARRDDLAGALAVAEQGRRVNPESLDFIAEHAEWLTRNGRHAPAIEAYEQLVRRAPDNAVYANNLAFLLSDRSNRREDLERALGLARAFEAGASPAQLDTLGWILYRLDRPAEAIEPLRKAVAAAPAAPLLQLHLGMALHRAGQQDAARPLLVQAIARGTDLPHLAEARRLLGEGG